MPMSFHFRIRMCMHSVRGPIRNEVNLSLFLIFFVVQSSWLIDGHLKSRYDCLFIKCMTCLMAAILALGCFATWPMFV